MILILVPARGGSKGLPGKNLAKVGGLPLVARAVRNGRAALRLLNEPGRVVCSTDDPAIAEAAKQWGADVPFLRPPELASDTASSIDVILHAIRAVGAEDQTVVVLQPTSPLTEPEDVIDAISLHRSSGAPIVSVVPIEHPLEWAREIGPAGELVASSSAPGQPGRRQDAVGRVRPNGAVYVASAAHLLPGGGFLGQGSRGLPMPAERSIDIDTASDLDAACDLIRRRSVAPVPIASHVVGPGNPCFVIAEAGVNHDGDPAVAMELVEIAARAGAHAVKFQTFSAQRLVARSAPKAAYQRQTTDPGESQLEMLRRLELAEPDLRRVAEHCRSHGILFLSTPFDEASADLLESMGVPAFKMSSGDLTNLPFLEHVARKGRPLIVSTGMATLPEVVAAVDAIRAAGNCQLILLHCVSSYPAPPESVNLRAMETMRQACACPVGFSDHTTGIEVALAAVALGAAVLEKHFTISRDRQGPDHRASIEPDQLANLVAGIRKVEVSLGSAHKRPMGDEAANALVARKSLVAARPIRCGDLLSIANIAVRRPGTGLEPTRLAEVLGRRARYDIEEGQPLKPEMIE